MTIVQNSASPVLSKDKESPKSKPECYSGLTSKFSPRYQSPSMVDENVARGTPASNECREAKGAWIDEGADGQNK